MSVTDRIDRFSDIVQIVERLAHAHEDNIGEPAVLHTARPFLDLVARDHDLRHDLLRGQIADKLLRAGMTEGAIQRAAHLAGDTQCARLADIRNEDAFTFNAWLKLNQPFLRTVDGNLVIGHGRAVEMIGLAQLNTQVFCDVRHLHKVAAAHMMRPAANLFGAHASLLWRHAESFHFCFQRRQRHARQRFRGRGCVRAFGEIKLDFHAAPISEAQRKCTHQRSAGGCGRIPCAGSVAQAYEPGRQNTALFEGVAVLKAGILAIGIVARCAAAKEQPEELNDGPHGSEHRNEIQPKEQHDHPARITHVMEPADGKCDPGNDVDHHEQPICRRHNHAESIERIVFIKSALAKRVGE